MYSFSPFEYKMKALQILDVNPSDIVAIKSWDYNKKADNVPRLVTLWNTTNTGEKIKSDLIKILTNWSIYLPQN